MGGETAVVHFDGFKQPSARKVNSKKDLNLFTIEHGEDRGEKALVRRAGRSLLRNRTKVD